MHISSATLFLGMLEALSANSLMNTATVSASLMECTGGSSIAAASGAMWIDKKSRHICEASCYPVGWSHAPPPCIPSIDPDPSTSDTLLRRPPVSISTRTSALCINPSFKSQSYLSRQVSPMKTSLDISEKANWMVFSGCSHLHICTLQAIKDWRWEPGWWWLALFPGHVAGNEVKWWERFR